MPGKKKKTIIQGSLMERQGVSAVAESRKRDITNVTHAENLHFEVKVTVSSNLNQYISQRAQNALRSFSQDILLGKRRFLHFLKVGYLDVFLKYRRWEMAT